jgi:hypothetical protein
MSVQNSDVRESNADDGAKLAYTLRIEISCSNGRRFQADFQGSYLQVLDAAELKINEISEVGYGSDPLSELTEI